MIRSQYRRLSLKHHPDKNPGNRREANKKFNEVAKAYKVRGGGDWHTSDEQASKACLCRDFAPKPAVVKRRRSTRGSNVVYVLLRFKGCWARC